MEGKGWYATFSLHISQKGWLGDRVGRAFLVPAVVTVIVRMRVAVRMLVGMRVIVIMLVGMG